MRIIAIRSGRNIKSNKKQKIIDNNKGVSCDTSFLVGERGKSCKTNVGEWQANISHEYLGENLIILFAQPHFRNLLFRI